MLVMKAWLETRWRLLATFAYLLICLFIYYHDQKADFSNARGFFLALIFFLVYGALTLAGSGVKSQSNIGFPEGLAGSTQFTISLPVSRMRLLGVRAAFGMLETAGAAVAIYCLTWGLFPVIRSNVSLADFARMLVANILCLTVPYFAAVFFGTFVDEPLSFLFTGWAIVSILWLAHHVAPSVV